MKKKTFKKILTRILLKFGNNKNITNRQKKDNHFPHRLDADQKSYTNPIDIIQGGQKIFGNFFQVF